MSLKGNLEKVKLGLNSSSEKNKSFKKWIIILYIINSIIIGVLISLLVNSNFWATTDGVEREMQIDFPGSKVLKIERNIFSNSVITFKKGEKLNKICLDSSIFFNYEFKKCDW